MSSPQTQPPSPLGAILSDTKTSTALHNFLLNYENMDTPALILAGGRKYRVRIASLNSAPTSLTVRTDRNELP